MTKHLATASSGKEQNRLHNNLRAIRKHKKMTLAKLAEMSDVSVATLSKVERGLSSLGFERFNRVASALDVDFAALFSGGEPFSPDLVNVARSGDFVENITENYDVEILFPQVHGKTMTTIMLTLKEGRIPDLSRYVRHSGQEIVFVVSGSVQILFERKEPVILHVGESAYFDPSQGHLYLPWKGKTARILIVCTGQNIDPPSG